MKIKSMLIVMLLISAGFGRAQFYELQVSSGTYAPLNDAVSLNNGMTWDDPHFTIPLGFTFNYLNSEINNIYIVEYGYGAHLGTSEALSGTTDALIAYSPDLVDRNYNLDLDEPTTGALSDISYQLEGASGDRILKIQWENAGFYDEIAETGESQSYMNFQLWLYENGSAIELHFGPNSIQTPGLIYSNEKGPVVGFIEDYDIDEDEMRGEAWELKGNYNEATMRQVNNIDNFKGMNNSIVDGTIYRFSKLVSGIVKDSELPTNGQLFPNPCTTTFNLTSSPDKLSTVLIYDAIGQRVLTIPYTGEAIDVSGLEKGLYFVEYLEGNKLVNSKLIKK